MSKILKQTANFNTISNSQTARTGSFGGKIASEVKKLFKHSRLSILLMFC